MSTATKTAKKFKLKAPPKYCNVFFNNDVTPFETVMHIFCKIFNYDVSKAELKAHEIHNEGKSVVFISSQEVCAAKFEMVQREKTKLNETALEHNVFVYSEDV